MTNLIKTTYFLKFYGVIAGIVPEPGNRSRELADEQTVIQEQFGTTACRLTL
jgi:hypothetical protein